MKALSLNEVNNISVTINEYKKAKTCINIYGTGYKNLVEKLKMDNVRLKVVNTTAGHLLYMTPAPIGGIRIAKKSPDFWILSTSGETAVFLKQYKNYKYTKVSWESTEVCGIICKQLVLDLDDRKENHELIEAQEKTELSNQKDILNNIEKMVSAIYNALGLSEDEQ